MLALCNQTRRRWKEVKSAQHIGRFHIQEFNQPWIENIRKENSRKYPKAKLEFPQASNNLQSIYIVLNIMSNLEIKYTEGCA